MAHSKAGAPQRPQAAINASISAALALVAKGTHTKMAAAKVYGLHPAQLTPKNIEARRKGLAPSVLKLVEIVVEVDGKPRNGRQILAEGINAGLLVMAELSPRIGALTKDEERRLAQAARWITLCRASGLLDQDQPAQALPSELVEPTHSLDEDWEEPMHALTFVDDHDDEAATQADSGDS